MVALQRDGGRAGQGSAASEWLGFVDVSLLKDRKLAEGETWVLATIESVADIGFSARLPGHPVRTLLFEGSVDRAALVGPVGA